MATKHDIQDIKICLEELEERILDEHGYIVRFNNLYEMLDNIFSALYESLDQTNSIEYLSFVRISFNLEVPEPEKKFIRVSSVIDFNRLPQEVSTLYRVEMNCGFSTFGV
jgi:hypothetical protein